MFELFDLRNETVVITGGAGLLGVEHAIAVAQHGGFPILVDISESRLARARFRLQELKLEFECRVSDLGERENVVNLLSELLSSGINPSALINNLDHNPSMSGGNHSQESGFETYPDDLLQRELHLGLVAATFCSQVFGSWFAQQGKGTILNVASDLGIIAPDQRVYQEPDEDPSDWPLKPPSYSISKFGLIGLTKYLASYWGHIPIRVNAVAFGSVRSSQSEYLISQLEHRIPLGRLATKDEYRGIIVFLLSKASSYVTGSVVVADGGRSII